MIIELEIEMEMEMPTPCQKCEGIFDLNDGIRSEKWFPKTIICASCGDKERHEIERDEEIEQLNLDIEDAEYTLRTSRERLAELQKEAQVESEPEPSFKSYCVHFNVTGVLALGDRAFAEMFYGQVKQHGRTLSLAEVRSYFEDCLAQQKYVLPFESCDNFDYQGSGCQGHTI